MARVAVSMIGRGKPIAQMMRRRASSGLKKRRAGFNAAIRELDRAAWEYRVAKARIDALPEDPCHCRKAGETGEDCPWKCPRWRDT